MPNLFRKTLFILIILIFAIGGLFLFSQSSKSYDDQTTHPGITDEIVDFYNLSFDEKLTSQEKEWIVQGSIDEDTPPRWINHFYDPVNKTGWSGENTGIWPAMLVQYFSSGALSSHDPVNSLYWLHAQEYQAEYGQYKGNRTWERAIYEAVNGNKKEAYYTLGFILHLMEDATVPDHTRNDTHAHELRYVTNDYGSPYEEFSKQHNRENLNIAKELKQKGDNPIIKSSINEYLILLAEYSNKYFFSKDTISNEKYSEPDIKNIKEEGGYGYRVDENGMEFPVVLVSKKWDKNIKDYETFYLLEKDDLPYKLILENYFSRLSRQAVLNGAGVINLFKQEVARSEKEKLQALPQESASVISVTGRYFQVKNFISNTWDSLTEDLISVKNYFSDSQPIDPIASVANIGQQLENLNSDQVVIEQDNITLAEEQQNKNNEIAQIVQQNSPIISENQNNNNIQQQQQLSLTQSEPEIIHAPYYRAPEAIHAPYQSSAEQTQNSNQAPGVITNQFQGQFNGSFAPVISDDEENQSQDVLSSDQDNEEVDSQQDYASNQASTDQSSGEEMQNQNTETQSEENAQQDPSTDSTSLPQASLGRDPSINSGQETPINSDQNSEPEPQPEPAPEPILPDINFYLTDYDVRKFDFTLNWEDRGNVAQNWELQYKLAPNFDWIDLANSSSLTANSFDFIAEYDDLTYYFRIRAQYDGGVYTDWIELPVDISSKPVAINEVAWMGTQASTSDEWIELANKTNQEIDLAGWILYINAQQIGLTGKISPNGFYLLERATASELNTENENNTVLNIWADQIYTGSLTNPNGNYGQQLILQDDKGDVIDTTMSAFAGDHDTKRTSERISVWASGSTLGNNWKTYSGQGGSAQDAGGNAILGTPKAQNYSADEFLALSASPNTSRIFLKNRGTVVLIENGISIPAGVKLLIEPGVALKFGNYGSLTVSGELIAKGTAEEKIVFTSSRDDENGGDTNGDGDATTAQKGDWMNLTFSENSGGEMDYAVFRYGVNIWTKNGVNNWSKSNVYIEKANVKISNSVFENSGGDALAIFNDPEATSPVIQLLGNEFRNNGGRGVAIAYANDLEIANNTFADNGEAGIWFGAPGGWRTDPGNINISDNIFTNNKAPMEINKFADFSISGNSMSSNANNGILVYGGGIAEAKDSVTVSSDMPFVFLDSGTVGEGKTLNLSPGTVFKFSQTAFGIYGTLNAVGTPDQPIVFTALEDDSYGGDTNNDGNATMPGEAAWYWMQFVSGENSTLDNVIVKYAGRIGYSMGGPPSGGSGIDVELGVSNFTLRNSTISDSVTGATISSDGATIENTVFSNNDQTGLNISANNATISNITFENNQKAFQSSSAYMATILLSSLIFNGNTYNYWPEDLIVQPQ